MPKIDEATLQHILRTYGKPTPSSAGRNAKTGPEADGRPVSGKDSIDREFETAGYDGRGIARPNPDQQKALIDFFQ